MEIVARLDMEIYVEYAFLENFLFDGALLSLALYAARMKIYKGRVILAASFGGGFALLFPLLRLGGVWAVLCKFAVGAMLCIIPFPTLKSKRSWKGYGLTTVLFFTLSFAFGGSLLGIYSTFSTSGTPQVSPLSVFIGFVGLTLCSLWLIRKLYARKYLFSLIFPCKIYNGVKCVQADGFMDSGNLAMKNGLPVCFLSPDLIYELFQTEEYIKEVGYVCDEMQISTLAGKKTITLYPAEIEVGEEKRKVYFARLENMIGREYKLLLNGRLMGERYETD